MPSDLTMQDVIGVMIVAIFWFGFVYALYKLDWSKDETI